MIDVVWGGVVIASYRQALLYYILLYHSGRHPFRLGVYANNQNFTLTENISGTDILSPSSFVFSKLPVPFRLVSSSLIPKL